MNVREMLELGSFSGSTVIAGSAGLGNEITSAMVLEAADIENWGKRGQLIITSFYALQPLTAAQTALLFRTMSAIGISAVAFKPERLVAEAPRPVIDLCNDFDLPLIKLSPLVKYEQILLDVLGHVIDSNLTLLNRFYESHQQVMALALKQPSIPRILASVKSQLHVEATYLDTMRDRRAGTDAARTNFTAYSLKRRDPAPYQTHAYYDARLIFDSPEETAEGQAGPPPREEQTIAARIPSSDGVDYYLILHNDGRGLSELDTMFVENIVSLLQMEILKQNAIKQKLFFQNNSTVHDLLLGRFTTRERVDAALTMLGIDEYPLYEAMLVRVSLLDPLDSDRRDDLQQTIRRRFCSMYPGLVYFMNDDRIIFLHNFRSALSGIDLEGVAQALEELHNSAILPPFSHLAVLSSSTERYSIPDANNEVVKVYRMFDARMSENLTLRFSDLGIYKLLLQAEDLSQLDLYVDSRMGRLAHENPDLFRTVVRLCENSLNYQKTAEELYVHPKTVRYRVDRAHDLYGIDVKNADDFLQIILTDRILSLGQGEK